MPVPAANLVSTMPAAARCRTLPDSLRVSIDFIVDALQRPPALLLSLFKVDELLRLVTGLGHDCLRGVMLLSSCESLANPRSESSQMLAVAQLAVYLPPAAELTCKQEVVVTSPSCGRDRVMKMRDSLMRGRTRMHASSTQIC